MLYLTSVYGTEISLTVVTSSAGWSRRALASEASQAITNTNSVVETRIGATGVAYLAQVALEAVLARAADRVSV